MFTIRVSFLIQSILWWKYEIFSYSYWYKTSGHCINTLESFLYILLKNCICTKKYLVRFELLYISNKMYFFHGTQCISCQSEIIYGKYNKRTAVCCFCRMWYCGWTAGTLLFEWKWPPTTGSSFWRYIKTCKVRKYYRVLYPLRSESRISWIFYAATGPIYIMTIACRLKYVLDTNINSYSNNNNILCFIKTSFARCSCFANSLRQSLPAYLNRSNISSGYVKTDKRACYHL